MLGLAGCSSLPASGPEAADVIRASEGPTPAFRIVDLDTTDDAEAGLTPAEKPTLAEIALMPPAGTVDQIEVGDTLQVTVFEVGASLFGNSGGRSDSADVGEAAPTANGETLPAIMVSPDGTIIVPYVGRVRAAGRTPTELATAIQAGLRGNSQKPQVVVTLREDIGNTVVIMGDVHSPGRKPLGYRRESLLDMIAIAGGAANDNADTLVRVTRRGRSVEMPLVDIISGTPDDIVLASQDRVELRYIPRTFTAFGAAGKVSEVPFHSDRLSLAEALARIGGPLDQQADPTGVFIFRAGQETGQEPFVYRLDLKNPKSYFVAQRFVVHDKDLIFVANARANSWQKFLGLVNTVSSPIITTKYLGL